MIRPFTVISMLLAAGSGLYLYQAKQQARMLDRQIGQVQQQTAATHQRAEVLRAEYTLLNDPTRLAELVAAHLPDLKPTQPAQWSSMAELDRRLPSVGDTNAAPSPLEPAAPDAAPAEAAPVAVAAPPPPLPAAAAPPHPAAVAHAAPPHPIVALARDPLPPVLRPVVPQHPVMHSAAASPSRGGGARSAPAAAPAAVPTVPVLATLRPAPREEPQRTVQASTPLVASALGMARVMTEPAATASAGPTPLAAPPGDDSR